MRAGSHCVQACIFILLLLIPKAVSADSIIVVADDWCPYNCEQDSDSPGYVVEVLREIFAAHKIQVEYKNLSWELALQGVEQGQYHAAIGATPAEIPSAIFPDEMIGRSQAQFITRANSDWHFSGIKSLIGVLIGGVRGYDYGEVLNQYLRSANERDIKLLVGDNATELNITGVYRGVIDVYVDDRNVILHKANKMGLLDELRFAGIEGNGYPIYVAFSPKKANSSAYADILSKGVQKLRQNGELKRILNKYGLNDWH